MNFTANTTLGTIVANNISLANTLYRYNLDFCCGGGETLETACKNNQLDLNEVIQALNTEPMADYATALQFNAWSTDLLIDYILKFHHDYIRMEGPKTLDLLNKVCLAHSDKNPELLEVKKLFIASLEDLFNHLAKEEQILFPMIYELIEAKNKNQELPPFHCGSIENPINVMEMEHTGEGDRYRLIAELTNNYSTPAHGCESYLAVMNRLKQFEQNLHIHIHVENNIIFPRGVQLQNSLK